MRATDCGCFGDLPVSPWGMMTLDFVAALHLLSVYLCLGRKSKLCRHELVSSCAITIVAALVLPWLSTVFLQSEKLEQSRIVGCKRIEGTEWYVIDIYLRNTSNQKIHIVGSRKSCGFQPSGSELQSFEPQQEYLYQFAARAKSAKGYLTGTAPFFVEDSGEVSVSNVRYFSTIGN